jgi:hypothetical protein
MPGMADDEVHGRIRGRGKSATSLERAGLLDVDRFRDRP